MDTINTVKGNSPYNYKRINEGENIPSREEARANDRFFIPPSCCINLCSDIKKTPVGDIKVVRRKDGKNTQMTENCQRNNIDPRDVIQSLSVDEYRYSMYEEDARKPNPNLLHVFNKQVEFNVDGKTVNAYIKLTQMPKHKKLVISFHE